MNWINSNEREPLNEGEYHCKYKGENAVLHFIKIQPKKEHFVINENYDDNLIEERRFWTHDTNSSTIIRSHTDLIWLDETNKNV